MNIFKWLPSCPDCNPIENLWGISVGKIYAHNKQYETKDELRKSILKACNEIGKTYID